jgi:hypothetical protein
MASGIWMVVRLAKGRVQFAAALTTMARYFALPGAALAMLYVVDLRLVVPGGGTAAPSLTGAYLNATAWTLAAPTVIGWRVIAVAVLGAAAVLSLRILQKDGTNAWVFFAGVVVVFPLTLMTLRQSNLIYARHFIGGTTLLLILCSVLLGSWWMRGGVWRAATVGALVVYALANSVYISQLLRFGRGQYSTAVAHMVRNTPGGLSSVGADHERRVGTVLRYYFKAASLPDPYVPQPWKPGGVQWLVTSSESSGPPVPQAMTIRDPNGDMYQLDKILPSAPLTGLHWFVYRHTNGEGR